MSTAAAIPFDTQVEERLHSRRFEGTVRPYAKADVERLRAFATQTLAPLRAYDEKHQTELERTLKLYFKVGQNIKTGAERLNVHRHTVFYRLRQIAEITGRSLESPHDQLTLRLAVAIDELHDTI